MSPTRLSANAAVIPRYGLFELTFDSPIEVENPFDPAQIRVEAAFIAPSKEEIPARAFWTQDYSTALVEGSEHLDPHGKPHWRVRFTPTETGTYRYRLRSATPEGSRDLSEGAFVVEPSDARGFIRRSPDPRYLQYDDGSSYFAIGHNVCWWGRQGTYDYLRVFDAMRAHGENWTRIWMIHWNVALEWSGGDPSTGSGHRYEGLGRYHLTKAWQLDRIFDLAAERGIAIMLCLDSFNTLRIRDPYPAYGGNPYAHENGGFLERPEEFFTHPQARAFFKRRLDYLIARYGWRTNLMAWEFWNEVDIIERYHSDEAVAWHREMARYLRENDPYDHLITTSYANTLGDDKMWSLPEIEFTQSHQYGSQDIAKSVRQHTRDKVRRFEKPHIFGELGTDAGGPNPEKDPYGVALHNGIWASALSEGAGTAMLWWWDNYIEPRNLYYHFRPLANFVQGVEWHRLGLRDAEVDAPEVLAMRVIGLQNDAFALLWIQNSRHTWHRLWRRERTDPVPAASFILHGLKDGEYIIEWWDTLLGEVTARETRRSEGGALELATPEIVKDIALKVYFK